MSAINVLFVCMGNICRSPTAEGVLSYLISEQGLDERIHVDSAGIVPHHAGEGPDPRARETALNRGIDLSSLRARQVCIEDFDEFQYILAMDWSNLRKLRLACPDDFRGRMQLFCDYVPHRKEREVPDPYYGGDEGFENVFDLVHEASASLLETLIQAHYPEHVRRR